MTKRTYRADNVQLAAFGIAKPEQGQLLDVPREPPADPPTGPRCVTCGAGLEHGAQCERCLDVGAEPLTLETE